MGGLSVRPSLRVTALQEVGPVREAHNKYLYLEMDTKLLEGFKNSKEKVNRCHCFPCQQWHVVIVRQGGAVQVPVPTGTGLAQ